MAPPETREPASGHKGSIADIALKWMSYRRQVVQNARRSRLSRSRSEVSSFIRSNHGGASAPARLSFLLPLVLAFLLLRGHSGNRSR